MSSPAELIIQMQRALGFQNTCKTLAKLETRMIVQYFIDIFFFL